MKLILTVLIATLLTTFIFFQFGVLNNWFHACIAILIVFVIAFLFTTVAANAIAIVGTNPVSGMTLMTLILSSLVLVSAGSTGTGGMTAAMIIGGVVCTALAMAGRFYHRPEDRFLARIYPREAGGLEVPRYGGVRGDSGRCDDDPEQNIRLCRRRGGRPQANAMAAVIKPLMEGGATPWMLYLAGAALALILTMIGVPALAFALGMFIPLELNTPLLVGGLISWYVASRSGE